MNIHRGWRGSGSGESLAVAMRLVMIASIGQRYPELLVALFEFRGYRKNIKTDRLNIRI
jgi:hypothetical protein